MGEAAVGSWLRLGDPASVLASQYEEREWLGEKKLALAIVMLAHQEIHCPRAGSSYGDDPDAGREWVCSDSQHTFSFLNCCRILGLDPHRARIALLSGAGKRFRRAVGAYAKHAPSYEHSDPD